jgi:hypothetical protein
MFLRAGHPVAACSISFQRNNGLPPARTSISTDKWDEAGPSDWIGESVPMKKPTQRLIAEVPRRHAKVEMTIGIDLGDVWSHYCTLNQEGEVVDEAASEPHRRPLRSG